MQDHPRLIPCGVPQAQDSRHLVSKPYLRGGRIKSNQRSIRPSLLSWALISKVRRHEPQSRPPNITLGKKRWGNVVQDAFRVQVYRGGGGGGGGNVPTLQTGNFVQLVPSYDPALVLSFHIYVANFFRPLLFHQLETWLPTPFLPQKTTDFFTNVFVFFVR